jgi:hypothetical protein
MMAITAFQWEDGPNHTQRVSIPWEIVMIRIRSGMVAVAGLLVGVLPTAAFAQLEETAARRAACMEDALMLCSWAIPNKARIATCLASKMDQLTPRCRAQFAKR